MRPTQTLKTAALFRPKIAIIIGIGLFLVILLIPWSLLAVNDFVSVRSSKTIRMDKAKGTAFLEGDVVVVQESTGSILTSDTLFIKRDSETNKPIQAKADRNVKAVLNDLDVDRHIARSVTINCGVAEVSRITNEAHLRRLVTIRSHDFKVTGDTVYYDLKNERGTITEIPGKQVLFTVIKNALPSGSSAGNADFIPEIVEGAADEIRLDRPARKAVLQGSVRVFDHSENVRFAAGKADIYVDQTENLERIIAFHNVVISQPKRLSSADRAVFDYQTETIVLTGNASVEEQGEMELKSSSITLFMNESKGVVSGGEEVPVKAKVKLDD